MSWVMFFASSTQTFWYLLYYVGIDSKNLIDNDLVNSVKMMALDTNLDWTDYLLNILGSNFLPFMTIAYAISTTIALVSDEPLCKNYFWKNLNDW